MGEWIPLMDYAMKEGISLSTLRRHIKANKIRYQVENGRYLLFLPQKASDAAVPRSSASSGDDYLVVQLQTKLKKAQEEIAELKTLIAFYESAERSADVAAHSLNQFNV